MTTNSIRGGPSGEIRIRKVQVAISGTVNAGSFASGGYAVAGLKTTDMVYAHLDLDSFGASPPLIVHAMVASAGTVYLTFYNPTGGPMTLTGYANVCVHSFG